MKRQVKEIKWIQIRKEEINLLLFPDDMILFITGPEDSARKFLHLTNIFSKSIMIKINIQKVVVSLYINGNTLKKKPKKQNHLKTSQNILE